MVSHVHDEVLAHHSQADEAEVSTARQSQVSQPQSKRICVHEESPDLHCLVCHGEESIELVSFRPSVGVFAAAGAVVKQQSWR